MNQICKDCGFCGSPKKETPGSIWLEIGLWIIFFPIGIIYSIWRLCATKKMICPKCQHADSMVPVSTPAGKALSEQYKIQLGETK